MRLAHTRTVNAHSWSVGSSALSPDGSLIASTGHSEVRLWDADSLRLVRTLEHCLVQDCAFSPDGRLLASVSLNGTLRVWDVPSGKHISTKNACRTLHACVFSPDSSLLTLGYENILHRWPMTSDRSDSGNLFVREGRSGYMSFCTVSPDGGRTVYPRYFLGLQVWDVFSGEIILTLDGHPGHVSSCTFSPDGRFVLAAGEDDLIWLWEADTGEQVHILSGHTAYVWECTFTPDGRRIVSVSKDKTLRVWDVETGEMTEYLTFESPLMSLGLHRSTPRMVCGDKAGDLHVVEMVAVAYGPLIVTAVKDGHGVAIRCPVCFDQHLLREDWLAQQIRCPGEDCDGKLRVNPFVVGPDE